MKKSIAHGHAEGTRIKGCRQSDFRPSDHGNENNHARRCAESPLHPVEIANDGNRDGGRDHSDEHEKRRQKFQQHQE